MHNITYHKAVPEDVKILVDNRILFAIELGGKKPKEMINTLKIQMTGYFLKAMAAKICISFIARCDGQVAGIGTLHVRDVPGNFKNPSGKWGYIMNMYTIPAHRRKGVCKGILHELVEDGKRMGITAFELHATEEGEFVYSRNGFEKHMEPTYRKYIL